MRVVPGLARVRLTDFAPFSSLLFSDPSDGQTWYLLGRCYMAQQKYRKAYDAYQQAVYAVPLPTGSATAPIQKSNHMKL